MKPVLGLVLAVGVTGVFAACGKKKDKDDDKPAETVVQQTTITLGQTVALNADIVFSADSEANVLEGAYKLTIDAEKTLQMRRTALRGDCGETQTAVFFVQGEGEGPGALIGPEADTGVIDAPLAAGTYDVLVGITAEAPCTGKGFGWDFVIEEAP